MTVPAIRERMVAVAAQRRRRTSRSRSPTGSAWPLPEPLPRALRDAAEAGGDDVAGAVADGAARATAAMPDRKVAILVADGVDGAARRGGAGTRWSSEGAVPRLVGPRIGPVQAADGDALDADASLENEPRLPVRRAGAARRRETRWTRCCRDGHTMEFIKDQYRHCKTILALGEARQLLEAARIPATLPDGSPDKALVLADSAAAGLDDFIEALCAAAQLRARDRPAPHLKWGQNEVNRLTRWGRAQVVARPVCN